MKIKTEFEGLKLNKYLTGMFDNESWACVFEITFIDEEHFEKLLGYLKFNRLIWFIGRAGLHIQ